MSSPSVTSSDPPARSLTGLLKTLPGSARDFARRLPLLARAAWKQERHWLWLVVPVLLMFVPFLITARDVWFGNDAAFWFQPLVPLLAWGLAWERRQDWQAFYRYQAEQFPANHKRRRGYFFPVVLVCLLFVLGSLTSIFALWVSGFVFGIVAVLYYLYGADLLKQLWMPLVYLLLLLPPPLGLVARGTDILQKLTMVATTVILGPFKGGAHFFDGTVMTPQINVPILAIDSGRSILLPVFAFTLWIAMRRRVTVFLSLALFIVGAILSVGVNLLRIILPALGNVVVPGSVTLWLNVVFVFLIVWLIDRLARFLTRRRPSSFGTPDGWQDNSWAMR